MKAKLIVLAAVTASALTLAGCGKSAPTSKEASVAMQSYLNQQMTGSVAGVDKVTLDSFTIYNCRETKTEGKFDCAYDMKYSTLVGYGNYKQTLQFAAKKSDGLFLAKDKDGKWFVDDLKKD